MDEVIKRHFPITLASLQRLRIAWLNYRMAVHLSRYRATLAALDRIKDQSHGG